MEDPSTLLSSFFLTKIPDFSHLQTVLCLFFFFLIYNLAQESGVLVFILILMVFMQSASGTGNKLSTIHMGGIRDHSSTDRGAKKGKI